MPGPAKNLRGRFFPSDTSLYDVSEDILLAAPAHARATIASIATSGTLYVVADCTDRAVSRLDFDVQIDRIWSYRLYRARNANPLGATITFTDATAVDNDDTFTLNGQTWTAKTSDAVAENREYNLGADNAAAAANLAAALAGPFGPGVTTSVAAVAATDVITIRATTAPVLQFGQGTSAANEIGWADTTLTRLIPYAATVTNEEATNTMGGKTYTVAADGWPYIAIAVINGAVGAAATSVGVIRY